MLLMKELFIKDSWMNSFVTGSSIVR